MIFFLFKKKPSIRYEQSLIRLTITKDEKFTFVYGLLETHDKDTFSIWVPKLREAREHPELPLEENMPIRVSLLEKDKRGKLMLYTFPSVAENIDDLNNIVQLRKPKDDEIEAIELGTSNEVKKYQLEARLKIKYRAEGSMHEQKGETYKIRYDGISMLTNVPIPPPMNLIVTVEIPFEQVEDKFQAKVTKSDPLPFEKKKYETVLEYIEGGISDELRKSIFQFALLHADISEPEEI